MSSHYIDVQCKFCDSRDSIYTGDTELDGFDDADWEGETIYVACRDCKDKGLGKTIDVPASTVEEVSNE